MENLEYVICKICGHKGRNITMHLKCSHNLSMRDYESKYNSPAISDACRAELRERALKWNESMNKGLEMVKKLKEIRHNCALLPQVREAQAKYMKHFLSTEEGKAFNRNNMKLAQQACGGPEQMRAKATEAKRNSEAFKLSHSNAMKKVLNDYIHNGQESGKVNRKKALENSRKCYTDCYGNEVKLRSSYELALFNYLVSNNIAFSYEELWIPYTDDSGINREYVPDFYLSAYNLIIEVKPAQFTQSKSVQSQANAAKNAGYNFVFVTERELKDLNSLFHNVILKFGS